MNRRPAVFLDRDGVIVVEKGYICPIEEIEIFTYAKDCIEEIHQKGYLAIVVTNQSGIARGKFTEEQLRKLHEAIKTETMVDAIYYCPHYKDGIVRKYAVDCNCRKPKTGLIRQACRDFEVDMSGSYMVGDRETDIQTGIHAGLKTVLLESGYGSKDSKYGVKPDFILSDLRDLINIL